MADKTGSCLCGAVAFEITGQLRPVIACHCHQCRKQTGTYMSSTAARMNSSGSPKHAASNGTAQAIRGGEGSASNAVRCCSGKVTGTTTSQLLPAPSTGSSASLWMATSSARAPGTTTRSPAGDFRHPDCTRRPRHLSNTCTFRCCAGSRSSARTAGVREAPRHEIAGGGSPACRVNCASLGDEEPGQVVFPGGKVTLDGAQLIAGNRVLDAQAPLEATNPQPRPPSCGAACRHQMFWRSQVSRSGAGKCCVSEPPLPQRSKALVLEVRDRLIGVYHAASPSSHRLLLCR